jgi:hypothetical protein
MLDTGSTGSNMAPTHDRVLRTDVLLTARRAVDYGRHASALCCPGTR